MLSSLGKLPSLALTLTPALFFLGMSLPLLSQDLPAPDTQGLLNQLEHVTAENQNTDQRRRAAALSQIKTVASSGSSAIDFYLQALESTKYRSNHQGFVDWDRQNDHLLHTTPYQNAVLMQLRYLCLALERDDQHDDCSQVPQALSYLNSLTGLQNATDSSERLSPEASAYLQQPLASSEIVEYLQVADLLPDGKSFAPAPGAYEEIMEKNVRVPLREKKDKRLPATWDAQIAVEAGIAKAGNTPDQTMAFNKSRLPDLLFKKAQDTALIGQPNRGISEVMLLIQHYPNNPSVKDWVDYARNSLTTTATNSTPAEAPGESTNAESSPAASPTTQTPASTPSPFGSTTPP